MKMIEGFFFLREGKLCSFTDQAKSQIVVIFAKSPIAKLELSFLSDFAEIKIRERTAKFQNKPISVVGPQSLYTLTQGSSG